LKFDIRSRNQRTIGTTLPGTTPQTYTLRFDKAHIEFDIDDSVRTVVIKQVTWNQKNSFHSSGTDFMESQQSDVPHFEPLENENNDQEEQNNNNNENKEDEF
jgi:hypothetical protein